METSIYLYMLVLLLTYPLPCPVSMNAAPPRTTSPPLVAVAKMLRKFASLGEPLDALR